MNSLSSSSTFKPKLTDQEYMELVFENGQFLAKSQRSNAFALQNQRTKSIVDLYEDEYNEDFKKSIDHGGAMKFVDTQTWKAYLSKRIVVYYENRKDNEFIPPDAQSVVAERSVDLSFDSTDFTEESEWSTYLSSSESDDPRPRVPGRTRKALVKRRRSNELNNSSEKKQRKDINKKMRTLQSLLPNSNKDDKESTLDEVINYVTTLQLQVQMMTMGNNFVAPAMTFPWDPYYYYQMGLPTCMQMGVPQFMPAPVLGTGWPWISNSVDMLSFLNHPGLMPMQNSVFFYPAENYFPQSVPPSCAAAFPNQIQNSTSLSNLKDAKTGGGTLFDKKKD